MVESTVATPRISSTMLNMHRGNTVRIVGRVVQCSNHQLNLETTDGGAVTVSLSSVEELPQGDYIEIIGIVQNDLRVAESNFTNFGDTMDVENYNNLLKLTQGFGDLF